MSASLLEMVLAIAIAGLIFAAAIIPTTQTVVAYQEVQAQTRQATRQGTAVVRPEQIAAVIWRDADAPENHDDLLKAQSNQLTVGDWELRLANKSFEQNRKSAGWAPIAEPVDSFAFQYLLSSGTWTSSVAKGQLGNVLALRFDWNDSDNGRKYGGLVVMPDQAFSSGLIELPQPDTSKPYKRKDYERTVNLSLGSWK